MTQSRNLFGEVIVKGKTNSTILSVTNTKRFRPTDTYMGSKITYFGQEYFLILNILLHSFSLSYVDERGGTFELGVPVNTLNIFNQINYF